MISYPDRVSCDDFDDCHDKIMVAGIDFIDKRTICGLYLLGEGCFLESPMRIATPVHLLIDGHRE